MLTLNPTNSAHCCTIWRKQSAARRCVFMSHIRTSWAVTNNYASSHAFTTCFIIVHELDHFDNGLLYKCCTEISTYANLVGNSVPELMEVYQGTGVFPVVEKEWTIIKNQTSSNVFPEALSNVLPPKVDTQPFEDSFLQSMFAYDYDLMGYKRSRALEMSCKEKDSKTFVALKDGKCVGFGSIKKSCLDAGRVGPLYADDPAVAEVLLKKLLEAFPERKGFAMMTLSSNVHANNLIKKLSCPTTGMCYRLHSLKRLIVDTKRIFAQSDMNFSPF
ncbi:n-acetyltransferase domain-containing protein [Trichonephila clavipes]|uniref:N-acetyltransferase domain-containing protein n=1 Tax=Trichonephila clavipes TaxID=2585209 RepID=A0A8X6S4P6_TRICX|nr:n-acetyltransferase domain-containing protein [Trichonephila clavipes]